MNNKFDELAKTMAQSVTRRTALKKFGIGLAGLALTTLGVENAMAAPAKSYVCCVYERYYPPTTVKQGRIVKVCLPPGGTCAPTMGGYDTYQYRLISQNAVQDCNHCK
jgi:hypothetical protein